MYIEGLKLVQRSLSLVINTVLFLSFCSSSFVCAFLSFSFSVPISLLHALPLVYIPPFVFHPHRTRVGWVRRISFCPI